MTARIKLLGILLGWTVPALWTHAASVVIGGSALATTEGSTGSNSGGFLGSNNFTSQYQIVSTDLAAQGLVIGSTILGVRARLQETATMTGDRTISDFEITLAQAANPFGSMSTSYAGNMVNPVLVRDGAYTFFDAQMPEGSIPNAFGQLVTFSSPYVYQGGDLIFMFSRPAITGGGAVTTDSHDGGGVVVQRLLTNSFHATTGTLGTAFSVLQLEFTAVPEPSRVLLIAVGLLSLGFARCRKCA